MIKDLLIRLNEYTEEPDAFETESERVMQKELEDKLDQELIKVEKENNRYIIQMICILNHLKDKYDFYYERIGKSFKLYFDSKYEYNCFIAAEKNSKRFNDCLTYFPRKTFEKLGNDAGARFLLLRVR